MGMIPVRLSEKALTDMKNQYAVVVCRRTGLTDEAHIRFSAYFGELDDVTPYQKAGRTHRLAYPELFDAGNIDPETGDVAPLTAAQVIGNKVSLPNNAFSATYGKRMGLCLTMM